MSPGYVDRLWVVAEARAESIAVVSNGYEQRRSARGAIMAVNMTPQELEWASPPSQFEGDTPISPAEQRLLLHLCAGGTVLLPGRGLESCEELGELHGRGVKIIELARVDVGGGVFVLHFGLHPDVLFELNV